MKAAENLAVLLEGECSSEAVLDALERLALDAQTAAAEELAEHDLDDVLAAAFERVSGDSHGRFVVLLSDLVSLMRDPRNVYPLLETHLHSECSFSLDAAAVVFVMRRDFKLEIDGFFGRLFECITAAGIEEDAEGRLLFLLTVFEDRSVPLGVVMPFVKKLCGLSLQTGSVCCHRILWTVLWIMRLHPMSYAMAMPESFRKECGWSTAESMDAFQPYLFELDILEESVDGIRRIVRAIRNEAKDAGNRPKLTTLASFRFPELKT